MKSKEETLFSSIAFAIGNSFFVCCKNAKMCWKYVQWLLEVCAKNYCLINDKSEIFCSTFNDEGCGLKNPIQQTNEPTQYELLGPQKTIFNLPLESALTVFAKFLELSL